MRKKLKELIGAFGAPRASWNFIQGRGSRGTAEVPYRGGAEVPYRGTAEVPYNGLKMTLKFIIFFLDK